MLAIPQIITEIKSVIAKELSIKFDLDVTIINLEIIFHFNIDN